MARILFLMPHFKIFIDNFSSSDWIALVGERKLIKLREEISRIELRPERQ